MQFLLTSYNKKSGRFEILGDEARHIAQVLRRKTGDVIRLFDGKGAILWGRITQSAPEGIQGEIIQDGTGVHQEQWPHALHVYQALPKGAKWDWVLEKGCEIGVSRFIPLISERTVVRIAPADVGRKLQRWRAVLNAASKQCGSSWIPSVELPMTPAKALAQAKESDLKLFAWESETADPIWKILSKKGFSAGESPLNPVAEAVRRARGTWGARGAAPRGPASTRGEPSGLVLGSGGKGDSPALNPYLSHLGRAAQTVALFIGPEGGWSIKEVEMAKEAGFSLVGLGPYVLRAETAPIVACSMIHALLSLSA